MFTQTLLAIARSSFTSLLQPRTVKVPHSRQTVTALVHPQHRTLTWQEEAMNNQHIRLGRPSSTLCRVGKGHSPEVIDYRVLFIYHSVQRCYRLCWQSRAHGYEGAVRGRALVVSSSTSRCRYRDDRTIHTVLTSFHSSDIVLRC